MAGFPRLVLLSICLAALLSFISAQDARNNGRDAGQLSKVEPGTPKYQRRNTTRCDPDYRELDGTCTNDLLRVHGSVGTAQYSYFDSLSSVNPTGGNLPSARLISNIVSSQSSDVYNDRKMSELITFFGQFLDHTIVASTTDKGNALNIPIPPSDPIFANKSGILRMERHVRGKFQESPNSPIVERPINVLSSAIDLASVYGSDSARLRELRAFTGGLMKTSSGNILTKNFAGLFNAPSNSPSFYLAGDHRANEHPVLTSIHSLFLREHNTLAGELKSAFPGWDDEMLFQMARKINIAQFQKIVYEEFFFEITGRKIRRYKSFRRNVSPAVSVTFSTAAYRVGHTLVGNVITRRGPGMSPMSSLGMAETFFRETNLLETGGIEPFIRGAIYQRAQEIDTMVVDTLRNFLFENVPQEIGFDLIALNIQRGRDHALPKYVDLASRFARRRIRSFSDITSNPTLRNKLSTAYGSVSNVEAWIGLMAEDHMRGSSMGPTMFAIWTEEFSRLRDGDRFFYLARGLFPRSLFNSFPRLRQIYSGRNIMEQIILRNTNITPGEIGSSVWKSNW